MTTRFLIVLSLSVLLALSACEIPGMASPLVGTNWRLVSYGSPPALQPAIPGTLTFGKDGQLKGYLGCNNFSGNYTVSGGAIKFGPLAATLMACGDAQMAQEAVAFQILKDTANFKLDGDRLIISSPDGNAVLNFSQVK